ncbi:FecR domain-containing protein [Maribacter polysiphoniae]|uniref:FecR domain-containing protein n=1 Tax=Maribacter polysiphoniae TaxID=429344 RepID=A0A316E4J1_9FLAO|nr:FecR family protein [Maribacter polysiphoniae]MBD1260574.1 FecR domain-containing protein [Maribacter polysiphoniae]PWK24299.1 FecR family protein [Maribacter polysiphoniae]
MTEKQFKELLDKYLQGKTSPKEEKILNDFQDFAISHSTASVFKNDDNKKRIEEEVFGNIEGHINKKVSTGTWMRIAASIVILIGIGTFFYNMDISNAIVITNNSETFKTTKLEDGSLITLNANSSLRFDNNHKGVRLAELDGEAFFEIARDEQKPFIITTGSISTKVLGTSFNIKETDSVIDVTVATGLVQVSNGVNAVKLKPNQRVEYSSMSKSFKTTEIDHNLYTSWYKNKAEFNEVRMVDLAKYLESRFSVNITFIKERTKNVQMTLTIAQEESLEDILNTINYISELKLTKIQTNEIEANFKNQ